MFRAEDVTPAKAGASGRPAETFRPGVPTSAGMTVYPSNIASIARSTCLMSAIPSTRRTRARES
jgi:hypothetical protein